MPHRRDKLRNPQEATPAAADPFPGFAGDHFRVRPLKPLTIPNAAERLATLRRRRGLNPV
jgi:hypothetical protein